MSEQATTPMPVPVEEAGSSEGTPGPPLVLLFGGTFDPPHRGHVELPVRVRDELERRMECVGKGWLVYVPAARSPHKEKGPAASDADRVEMLRRSLAGVERVGVWTEEIDRAVRGKEETESGGEVDGLEEKAHGQDARDTEPSYTVDTVRCAREWLDDRGMSGTALRLLIGADQALGFHRWLAPREVAHTAGPVVMVRGDVADSDDLVIRLKRTRYWRREELEMWREGMVEVGRLDVSATLIRRALRDGDEAAIAEWLAPGVAAYIRERGLYGAG
jgi:nicotinate-nucleotide adenylyltransferase